MRRVYKNLCLATISASLIMVNLWKNSLKNAKSDTNKILYETLLNFFYSKMVLTFWMISVYLGIWQKEWWWTSHSSNLTIKLMMNQKNWNKSSAFTLLNWDGVWGPERWTVAYKSQGYQNELGMSRGIFLLTIYQQFYICSFLTLPCVSHVPTS
jgi:hypothetical protein